MHRDVPIVLAQRAQGKTTGLALFIGERILTSEAERKIMVIFPTELIMEEFRKTFEKHFPTLQGPRLASIRNSSLRGEHYDEVYLEEVLLFKPDELHQALHNNVGYNPKILVGIGSIQTPTTVTLRV
jgi:hypothetical protein